MFRFGRFFAIIFLVALSMSFKVILRRKGRYRFGKSIAQLFYFVFHTVLSLKWSGVYKIDLFPKKDNLISLT